MPAEQISRQDYQNLDRLLHENGDRTAFYLHYYELTGNAVFADMAQISHLSGFPGRVAENANAIVKALNPELYPDGPVQPGEHPTGGLKAFSEVVAASVFEAVKDNLEQGGTGVLTEREALDAAKAGWEQQGLGDWFPGHLLMQGEFWTPGTLVSLAATAEAVVAPGFTRAADYQAEHPNSSYHVTEDGKFGFFVDRESGIASNVILHQEDHVWGKAEWATGVVAPEPVVESRGVLIAVPTHEPAAESPSPAPAVPAPTPVPETNESGPTSPPSGYLDGLIDGAAGAALLADLAQPTAFATPAPGPPDDRGPWGSEAPGPVPVTGPLPPLPPDPISTSVPDPVAGPSTEPAAWSSSELASPFGLVGSGPTGPDPVASPVIPSEVAVNGGLGGLASLADSFGLASGPTAGFQVGAPLGPGEPPSVLFPAAESAGGGSYQLDVVGAGQWSADGAPATPPGLLDQLGGAFAGLASSPIAAESPTVNPPGFDASPPSEPAGYPDVTPVAAPADPGHAGLFGGLFSSGSTDAGYSSPSDSGASSNGGGYGMDSGTGSSSPSSFDASPASTPSTDSGSSSSVGGGGMGAE